MDERHRQDHSRRRCIGRRPEHRTEAAGGILARGEAADDVDLEGGEDVFGGVDAGR